MFETKQGLYKIRITESDGRAVRAFMHYFNTPESYQADFTTNAEKSRGCEIEAVPATEAEEEAYFDK